MRYIVALLLALAMAVPAFAAFEGPGTTQPSTSNTPGFHGPRTGAISTVAAVMKARDDAYCTLEGRLIEKLAGSDDKYVFEDSTGKVIVDIDHKKFAGRTVTPQNLVRLTGEVDVKHSGKRIVDVDMLEILK